MLNISDVEVQRVMEKVSHAVVPKPCTARDLIPGKKDDFIDFFPLGLDQLDRVLHGGLPAGTITEIAGPSGCGKTQFSIMLSLLATLPIQNGGLDGGVIYIDTESAFSAERLAEMAQCRFPDLINNEESILKVATRVHVYLESTCSSLFKRLQNLEEDIISKGIKLIVLDSVASLVRKEFDTKGTKNITQRTNLLAQEAAILKYLAESFKIPVVVTNQITTRYGQGNTSDAGNDVNHDMSVNGMSSMDGDGGYVTAALGNTWSHSVNTRLIVQYLDNVKRQILIAKSPVAPFAAFTYTIEDKGIVLQESDGHHYDGTDPGLQHIRVKSAIQQDILS
ncbi:unnamed protein product [Owenia fusiformis]|uniref:DNA repair protein RAD51 homolog 2 n=1 Tax=Owenia fusiformis TaxID=6347 RepID=A0A8S4PB96_OWEFU|nr:unnamed protein product [Owenia fusiformis]